MIQALKIKLQGSENFQIWRLTKVQHWDISNLVNTAAAEFMKYQSHVG